MKSESCFSSVSVIVCFLPIHCNASLSEVNWIGRVCVELRLTRVSWKKLSGPKICTCEFMMGLMYPDWEWKYQFQFTLRMEVEKELMAKRQCCGI